MRLFVVLSSLLVGVGMIFKSRYKIMNTLMAVSVIRKAFVSISMNMPYIRKRVLPSIFGRSAS
ncbi:hypothetical protein [Aquibacillus kalidii]|uniref:hypothetical protein n=1 Tax=Aquibacillus kalidii TaxID=2762597 RepID=UPI0016466D91|nr:hypothetical protein [Aquibacillus kalidii]